LNPRTPTGQAPQACASKTLHSTGLFDLAWQHEPPHTKADSRKHQARSRRDTRPGQGPNWLSPSTYITKSGQCLIEPRPGPHPNPTYPNQQEKDVPMATRRRKTRRLRGSRCHGWGRSGQHRDSGMQGGHGNAGWKRHRWSSVIRYGWEIGTTGFVPVRPKYQRAINIDQLSQNLQTLSEQGKTKSSGNRIEVDLGQIGYTKLLGKGNVTQPLRIIVAQCSEMAASKISQAGGEIVLPKPPEASKEG
jgi:large subunit ribosomal protein L15